jgi:hypothetical protein
MLLNTCTERYYVTRKISVDTRRHVFKLSGGDEMLSCLNKKIMSIPTHVQERDDMIDMMRRLTPLE